MDRRQTARRKTMGGAGASALLACALSLTVSLVCPAVAQSASVDVPAGPLAQAIAILARQTGASIGVPAEWSALPVPAVRGHLSVDAALHRMLRRTRLRAVSAGASAWRIAPARIDRTPPPSPPLILASAEIVVTATKQRQRVADAALPLAVADRTALAGIGDAADTGNAATILNGLSSTNLGPGRDRLFLRGIADSPFDGFGQSSVSVQVDEARLTYDAPDPGLRLIDLQQVELLKGPQGPLYGTGALGGVYRLVPQKPDLTSASGSLRIGAGLPQGGAMQGAIDGIVNLPLIDDRLAARIVGYRIGQGGWIDEPGRGDDINSGHTTGARLALRAVPGGRWTIDASGWLQTSRIADSQYVEGDDTLTRAARLPEPQRTHLVLAGLSASGPFRGLTVTAAANTTWQELDARYDASDRAAVLGGGAPATYRDDRRYQVNNAELRIAHPEGPVSWLAGASLLIAETDAHGDLIERRRTVRVLRFQRKVGEAALFGEATWHATPSLRGTLGLRLFRSSVDDERRDQAADTEADRATLRGSPSATVAWQPGDRLLVFVRAASALRPGGIQAAMRAGEAASRYDADTLQSIDLGVRWQWPERGLSIDAGLFATNWDRVQADFLRDDGLVSTRNAGRANNSGIDLTLGWRPPSRWSITGGLLLQHARIDPGNGTGDLPDRRLPVVPDVSAHVETAYRFPIGTWEGTASARGSFVGKTRLSFDPGLDRRSEAVALAGVALAASRDPWTVRIGIDNLTNSRADSFSFGNPFSIGVTDQHTPIRPRTVSLSLMHGF